MTRRAALNPAQMAFTFEAPAPATAEASLAGLDRFVAALVARALREDERPRAHVAGVMTGLLDDDVSKMMLDAYASEARETHNISAARFLALIAATERFDLLDAVLTRIGARVLVGDEINTARLGHLKTRIAQLQAELKEAERTARPITRGGSCE